MSVRYDPILGKLLTKYIKTTGDTMTGPLSYSGLLTVFSTGLTNPTSGTSVSYAGATTAWTNPGNILTSNNTTASLQLSNIRLSQYLTAQTFGFTLPSDAVITSITASIERSANIADTIADTEIRLLIGGVVNTLSNKSTGAHWLAIGDNIVTYIWSSPGVDFPVLAAADVNASNFGFVLAATGLTGVNRFCQVDNMQLTIAYTSATGATKTVTMGLDSTDYARYKISVGSTLGTNDVLGIDTTNSTSVGMIVNEDGFFSPNSNVFVVRGSNGAAANIFSVQKYTSPGVGTEVFGVGVAGGVLVSVDTTPPTGWPFPASTTPGGFGAIFTTSTLSTANSSIIANYFRGTATGSLGTSGGGTGFVAAYGEFYFNSSGSADLVKGVQGVITGGSSGTMIDASVFYPVLSASSTAVTRGYNYRSPNGFGSAIATFYGYHSDYLNIGTSANYGIYLAGASTETAHFETGVATAVGLTIQGFSAQSANLFRIRNSTPTDLFYVGPRGQTEIDVATATDLGLILKTTDDSSVSALLSLQTSGGTAVLTGRSAISGSSTTSNFLSITATLNTTNTQIVYGNYIRITSAGSSNKQQHAFRAELLPGYTGTASTAALSFINTAASTGTGVNGGNGNYGIIGGARATTTGTNISGSFDATGGNQNVGVIGVTYGVKVSALNIAVYGAALSTGAASMIGIGGYFTLNTAGDDTYTGSSAAIIGNNYTTTSPILILRDNGVDTFTVADGGQVTSVGNIAVPDEAYGSSWNGSTNVPTKNAIYDKIETIASDVLFDHYTDAGNVGTGEDDLYSDTIAAGQLAIDGQKIVATYQGIFSGAAASTQDLRVYFGGTLIYDSGALSIGVATDSWTAYVTIIRESSSVVRCAVSISTDFATLFPYSKYTRITGLTLASTQILKITGEAAGVGAANDQIVSKLGYIQFVPAA